MGARSKSTTVRLPPAPLRDHPIVAPVVDEAGRYEGHREELEKRLAELEVREGEGAAAAVDELARGNPAGAWRALRRALADVRDELELAERAATGLQERLGDAAARAREQIRSELTARLAPALRDLNEALARAAQANEAVREVWAEGQRLDVPVARLFWTELLAPRPGVQTRVGHWRSYVRRYFPAIANAAGLE